MRKMSAILLVLVMVASLMAGCSAVGDIAGNVASAAMEELENQVKAVLEKNKVDVVELKTDFGKLNDEGSKLQFFCAALIRSENETAVEGCAKALDGLFEHTGVQIQTGSKVENAHLIHKDITYDHSDFTDGSYYTIYVYTSLSLDAMEILPNRSGT